MQRHTGKGSSSRSSCGDVLRGTQQAGMSVLRLLSVPLHPCASAVDLFTFHFSLFTFHFSLFTFHFSLFTFRFSLLLLLLFLTLCLLLAPRRRTRQAGMPVLR